MAVVLILLTGVVTTKVVQFFFYIIKLRITYICSCLEIGQSVLLLVCEDYVEPVLLIDTEVEIWPLSLVLFVNKLKVEDLCEVSHQDFQS